jgi:hypothetical protein
MKVALSFKLSGLMFLPIVLASGAQASDWGSSEQADSARQTNQWVADPSDIQRPFLNGGNLSKQSAIGSDPDPVMGFRPFTAPDPHEQNGAWPNPAPPRPIRAKAANTASAVDSFRPFSEPTEPTPTSTSATDQPPPGSTLNSDGHKDKLFNPQLSSHSNTTYRSTSGYVLGKTGKYALRYGPRILQFIRY